MRDQRQDFLNLPFQEKLEFLYGLPARQKLDLILSAPEAERLVQSFAPQTLFYTLKEIGLADAGDLLIYAVPEQVKWLFDLDCWDKDQPNLARMREWIEALADGGRRRLADGLMELDLELVSLLLRQYLRVHRVDEPQENTDAPSDRFVQFDEHYLLEFIRHDSIQPHLLDFIEEAFERDYNYFAGLMEEIYWGVEAELEEEAYQFRNARLADHGFPNYYDAQAIFSYLNPSLFLEIRRQYIAPLRDLSDASENGALPPELAPTQLEGERSLFNIALTAGFAAQGARQLRSEMALVSNQVLVARAIDFGDPEAVRGAVEMTHDYLNLALEHLAGGELEAAIEHLRDTHLTLLFRLGVSLTIDLRKRASESVRQLGFEPNRTREIPYLDSPYREALAGMMARQPVFFDGLERGEVGAVRNFQAMRDIHLGYAMLEQIDAATELVEQVLGARLSSVEFRASVAGREVRLSQILTTALVRHALEGCAQAAPLPARELGIVRAAIVTGRPGRLNERFQSATENFLQSLEPGLRRRAEAFAESCVRMLEDEFAELEPTATIDPRFIRSLLLHA